MIRNVEAALQTHIRPHSALGYRPPAPTAIIPAAFPISVSSTKHKNWYIYGAGHNASSSHCCPSGAQLINRDRIARKSAIKVLPSKMCTIAR